ncbi:hypothetical protein ACWFRF_15400 [Nocardia sp. NPDC055165]
MKRVWVVILLSQFSIALLFVALLVTVTQRDTANKVPASVLPIKGDDGRPAVVDYEKIDGHITEAVNQAVAALPKPTVKPEPVNYPLLETAIGTKVKEEVAKLPAPKGGSDGKDGVTVLKVEFRQNPSTDAVEWRCLDDNIWSPIKNNPILGDSCP